MRTSQHNSSHGKSSKKRTSTKNLQKGLAIAVIVITLALFALIYILYSIIQENQDSYNQIVLSQQNYESRTIPYRRGDILDRNNTYLATTQKVYNLILDPQQILLDEENYLETSVSALVSVFGYDASELRTLIHENPSKQYIRYKRQLSYEQKEAFENLKEETNKKNASQNSKARVRGVWFEEEYKRIYPYNSTGASIIGFVNGDGMDGAIGIERSYNEELTGINGREYGYLNDDSNLERVIKSATNGNTIVTTIDLKVQDVVEKNIRQWQNETGSEHIGVVVMNPNNGEVLAMASEREFDLNNPRDLKGKFTEEELWDFGLKEARDTYNRKHKEDDPISLEQVTEHFSDEDIRSYGQQVAWNQNWRNYCISDTYEPGSPQKIFTVAAAMEEGVINGTESFLCDGYQEVGGWPIACVKTSGHGNLTVTESLMQSCNDCMMQIAAMTGKVRFSKYQKMFGFGSRTGIDLPGEADAKSLVYDENNMDAASLATNSFGQNYNCTMIQMAAAYCSVINGGSYYEPHIVRQILNEQGAVVKRIDPKLVRETVSESTAAFIREALFRTVSEGTGKAAAVEGYEIAGKTGTGEKYPRGNNNYLVSFCGFAPASDPQVLVYVTIDEPHVEDQPHSSYASGVFQKIMTEILPYLNIFPITDPETDLETFGSVLPEREGITDNTALPEPEETKVYETDEFIEPGAREGAGVPAQLPGGIPEESSEAEEEELSSGAEETAETEETETETSG